MRLDMLAPVEDVEGQSADDSDSDDDATENSVTYQINLEENMYGAVVYVWARKTTETGFWKYSQVFVASVLFLLTLYIQVVFGWYMIPLVSLNEFEEKVEAVNQFVAWRAVTDDQKANFTCFGSEWSWSESVVDEMAKYNKPASLIFQFVPMTQGKMFGVLSMGLWVCLLVIQMRAALTSLSLFGLDDYRIHHSEHFKACVVRHRETHHNMLWNIRNNRGEWFSKDPHHMSSCSAKLVILGTFLARTTATAGFGYYGMAFLAYTDNLRDFILNCVALGFVFEIPDIIYRAFALLDTQQQIRDMNTAFSKAKVTVDLHHTHVFGQFIFLLIVAIGPLIYGLNLLSAFSDMQLNQVFRELCATVPGNTSEIFS